MYVIQWHVHACKQVCGDFSEFIVFKIYGVKSEQKMDQQIIISAPPKSMLSCPMFYSLAPKDT